MNLEKLLLVCSLLFSALCTTGVDVSQLYSTSTYSCMKSQGTSFVIVRGYKSSGTVDSYAVANLKNARSAGIKYVDVYMFPCRGKNATTQVNQMMAAINGSFYGMVWLDVETNPSSGCSWSGYSATSNCGYVQELVSAVKANGKAVGIYSSSSMWQTIMGSRYGCKNVASQPLWYAHYDNTQSFSDFQAFGGWTKPTMKQYKGDTTLCGASVDMDYY